MINANLDAKEKNMLAPEEITAKDVTKTYLRWHFANEIPHSFERYVAPSLLYAMMPILRKLYKDEDQLRAAYKRQLLFLKCFDCYRLFRKESHVSS